MSGSSEALRAAVRTRPAKAFDPQKIARRMRLRHGGKEGSHHRSRDPPRAARLVRRFPSDQDEIRTTPESVRPRRDCAPAGVILQRHYVVAAQACKINNRKRRNERPVELSNADMKPFGLTLLGLAALAFSHSSGGKVRPPKMLKRRFSPAAVSGASNLRSIGRPV